MTRVPSDSGPSLFGQQPPEDRSRRVTSTVATYTRAIISIVYWGLIAVSALVVGWLCLRSILWAAQVIAKSLGV